MFRVFALTHFGAKTSYINHPPLDKSELGHLFGNARLTRRLGAAKRRKSGPYGADC